MGRKVAILQKGESIYLLNIGNYLLACFANERIKPYRIQCGAITHISVFNFLGSIKNPIKSVLENSENIKIEFFPFL